MKKKLAMFLAIVMIAATLLGAVSAVSAEGEEGKVFNIYAWNEEFKGFFDLYFQARCDELGITVNWIINPSDGGVYQQKLDEALFAQADAAADDRVDMFLAEADYIGKYVDSDFTMSIDEIGFTNADTQYAYTILAATSAVDGKCKGVSFQCCPSALIYRRSIAKAVLGTDDPAEVQAALSDWDKFAEVAAKAKEQGFYMTPSFAETYRVFSNNCTSAWVDEDNNLQIDSAIQAWIDQTDLFVENGYTITCGIWDDEKNAQMYEAGKTMCFFGPAWYFNFCMGPAHEELMGDWAICQGPQAHFWGGTWLLAATGSDNPSLLKEIFYAFTQDEEICTKLVAEQSQYPNNTTVVAKFAADPDYGNAFLGGQNDIAAFAALAGNIVWENHTNYDQLLNEGLQSKLQEYWKGNTTKEEAMNNFYQFVNETYPAIVTP